MDTSVTSDDIKNAAEEVEKEEENDQKIKQMVDGDQGGLSASQLKQIGDTVEDDNGKEDPSGAYNLEGDSK
jgi:hypothetical protein